MTPIAKRKWIDFAFSAGISTTLNLIGAGFWAYPLCLILAIWNYYDGATRDELRATAKS